jgi:hypothetical protein
VVAKLVYIGGYGRSGSTLLEYLLSASPKVVACGEVAAALTKRVNKETCTCGRPVKDCPVWGPVKNNPGRFDGWTHRDLTLALLRQMTDRDAIMVDSSKTAWSSGAVPFNLVRAVGKDFLLVHVVRDPRPVCWSALKKAEGKGKARVNRPLFCCLTVLGWWVANLFAELFGWAYPDQYARVRYEDLASRPKDVVSRLLCSDYALEDLQQAKNRHQLYGNRMRTRPLSAASVKEDCGWKREMPVATRRLAYILSWPLRLRYGYR